MNRKAFILILVAMCICYSGMFYVNTHMLLDLWKDDFTYGYQNDWGLRDRLALIFGLPIWIYMVHFIIKCLTRSAINSYKKEN